MMIWKVAMTAFLIALVVLVGVVAVLNLVLTVGVIRRLRQHTEKLADLSAMGPPMDMMIGAGERVGEFAATTTDGEPVSRELLFGQTLVGVLSPDCSACKERLPEFIARAEAFPGGRGQVLAVLAGEPAEVQPYRERLAPVARVVIEPPTGGPLATALNVQGYPAFAVLDSTGTVVAGESDLPQPPVMSPAST
ncbi:TlpA disulfide reductase family protein [Phytohabitans kaempferiae]|uniref:TlpA disulfide reductase family protein n=1 Tax=Phytohabitans kaempferiae TaxID=1620943 RepID=A0ABV6MAE8_9ACTN